MCLPLYLNSTISISLGTLLDGATVTSSLLFLSKGYIELPFTLKRTLLPSEISDSTCKKNMSLEIVFIMTGL